MSSIPKVQHYVPQFVLRNHCKGRKDHLWTFDKQQLKVFQSNIRNLASASRFYDSESADGRVSLEPTLGVIESAAKPLIAELLKRRRLDVWSAADREKIALFLAVQHLRTQAMRDMQLDMDNALRARLANESMTDEFRRWLGEPSKDENKKIMLDLLADAHGFAPHFYDKVWFLLSSESSATFFIGDHPIALNNQRRDELRGTLGLAVPGIEIYFPVSPTLTLGLLSPELGVHMRRGASDPDAALICSAENVAYQNSLQVVHASRFVYCIENDFALVSQMLTDNPSFGRGRTVHAG